MAPSILLTSRVSVDETITLGSGCQNAFEPVYEARRARSIALNGRKSITESLTVKTHVI